MDQRVGNGFEVRSVVGFEFVISDSWRGETIYGQRLSCLGQVWFSFHIICDPRLHVYT